MARHTIRNLRAPGWSALAAVALLASPGWVVAGEAETAAERAAAAARIAAPSNDYDHGYRDGYLNRRSNSAGFDKRAYAAGYSAGQAARARAARPPSPLPAARSVNELPGRPAAQLAADMTALGYRNIGQFTIKRETFSDWRGSSDNDCVRVAFKDGRVAMVTALNETDCRR